MNRKGTRWSNLVRRSGDGRLGVIAYAGVVDDGARRHCLPAMAERRRRRVCVDQGPYFDEWNTMAGFLRRAAHRRLADGEWRKKAAFGGDARATASSGKTTPCSYSSPRGRRSSAQGCCLAGRPVWSWHRRGGGRPEDGSKEGGRRRPPQSNDSLEA